MKKYISIIIMVLILLPLQSTYAGINGGKITITSSNKVVKEISRENIFTFFASFYSKNIPESYKYININYRGVDKGSKLEDSLQKLIYLDLIENPKINIQKNKPINAWGFFRLSEKIFTIKINDAESKSELLSRNVSINDLKAVKKFISNKSFNLKTSSNNKSIKIKTNIFNDVYSTILNNHYYKSNLSQEKIIESAIQGLANGSGDKHTVYFPPIESSSFKDSLSGEYEGIGSYVDMEKPGQVRIISPIPGSPSEKAGLKGGDLIIEVDGKKIGENNSLKEVITWIKGPAGSNVILTIKRGEKIINITVIREKIIINDIESEKINSRTYYIKIKSFGEHVSDEFKKSLEEITSNKGINRIIIDLRNNGGGYLSEVTEMLSYIIPKGEKTAVVKYNYTTKHYNSKGYNLIDFGKYKIVILQNSGTASASEIMIGTLKDYFPNIITLGEKSYGKGSVQVIKAYSDGSALKYTIAKWFTGKTETGIDGIGIIPDFKLEFDIEKYKRTKKDNQLEKAKIIY